MTSSTPGGGANRRVRSPMASSMPSRISGSGDELPELGQAPERLHAPDHGIERLAVAGRDLERARRAVERAGDERALPGDEGADAGVDAPRASAAIRRRPAPGRASVSSARAEPAPRARCRHPPIPRTRRTSSRNSSTACATCSRAAASHCRWPSRRARANASSPAAARAIGCWLAMSADPRSTRRRGAESSPDGVSARDTRLSSRSRHSPASSAKKSAAPRG